jgi:hypothetical protein
MKKKIFLTIYILLMTVVLYWAFSILRERYIEKSSTIIPTKNEQINNNQQSDDYNSLNNDNTDNTTDNLIDEDDEKIEKDNDNQFLEITKEDCDSECSDFNNSQDKKYCQQVCGLTTTHQINNCENKEELERDYCWKDLALNKKDFELCQKISDTGIKKTCQNRITEEILNGQ